MSESKLYNFQQISIAFFFLIGQLEHGNIYYCSFKSHCKNMMFFLRTFVLFSRANV